MRLQEDDGSPPTHALFRRATNGILGGWENSWEAGPLKWYKATGDHSCRRSDSSCLALRRVVWSLQRTLITRDIVYDHSLSMLILKPPDGLVLMER